MRTELGLTDSFVLLYSGNVGVSHEFETLLRGFAAAADRIPELKLVFVGGGARLAEVKQLVEELGLVSSVKFATFVPSSRLPESLGLADLGVVTLREGFAGLVVPSKLAGYLSRGIPVLYIGPRSDAEAFVSKHDCGFTVANGSIEAVAQVILDAHGDRQRLEAKGEAGCLAYHKEFCRESSLAKYESVVRACIELVKS